MDKEARVIPAPIENGTSSRVGQLIAYADEITIRRLEEVLDDPYAGSQGTGPTHKPPPSVRGWCQPVERRHPATRLKQLCL